MYAAKPVVFATRLSLSERKPLALVLEKFQKTEQAAGGPKLQAVAQGGVCGFAKTGEYGLGPRCPRDGRDERLPDSEK
jgi:hypothetical protein